MPFKGFVESEGCRLIILIGAARSLERGLQRESFKVFVGPSHHLEWKKHRRLQKDLHRQSETVAADPQIGQRLLRLVVGLEAANSIAQIVPVIVKTIIGLRRTVNFLLFIHRLNLWHQLLHQTIRQLQGLPMAWVLRRDHRLESALPRTNLLHLVLEIAEQRQRLLRPNTFVTILAIVKQADSVLQTRQKVILR